MTIVVTILLSSTAPLGTFLGKRVKLHIQTLETHFTKSSNVLVIFTEKKGQNATKSNK